MLEAAAGKHSSRPGKDERGPDDDLRLEFESTSRLDPDEKQVVRTVIRGIVLQHEARRLGMDSGSERKAVSG